jgi:hypothetical protein
MRLKFPASCGSQMKRVPEVLDCWFESGSMPYAQVHYPFENKEWFEANFPAKLYPPKGSIRQGDGFIHLPFWPPLFLMVPPFRMLLLTA